MDQFQRLAYEKSHAESELDNLLVRQKDLILQRVNDGAFNEALAMLDVVRELWLANTYEYKFLEITNRIYLTIARNEV